MTPHDIGAGRSLTENYDSELSNSTSLFTATPSFASPPTAIGCSSGPRNNEESWCASISHHGCGAHIQHWPGPRE
eukprot:m.47960 g.47960  ORF g.47960 m.47960 type:complete len:75 (+) comp15244_c1_seq5:175-399(+)